MMTDEQMRQMRKAVRMNFTAPASVAMTAAEKYLKSEYPEIGLEQCDLIIADIIRSGPGGKSHWEKINFFGREVTVPPAHIVVSLKMRIRTSRLKADALTIGRREFVFKFVLTSPDSGWDWRTRAMEVSFREELILFNSYS